jgi:D-tyrosyl-tRNA(Tyr) deacylase
MRAIIQRVTQATVDVAGVRVGAIERGVLVLLGIGHGDGPMQIDQIAKKILELRIFDDASGKPNISVVDSGGAVLLVSQFTLYADTSRGRRPGYAHAAPPAVAEPLCATMAETLRRAGVTVATGVFGAEMQVSLINDGPYTIILDSDTLTQPAGMVHTA